MQIILVIVKIYNECLKKAFSLCVKNWRALFSVFGYTSLIGFSLILSMKVSLIGGLIFVMVTDACMSSFLFMVENIIKERKPNLEDFKKGFFVYFWDIVNIGFAVGIPFWIATEVLLKYPKGVVWIIFLRILTFLFFNATPELIYTGSHNTLEIFQRSYKFIVVNWIEWFIPNILFILPFFLILLINIPYIDALVKLLLVSFLLYFIMVFRGLLFKELYETNVQQRLFKYRVNDK